MKYIPIDKIEEGMILAKDIYDDNGYKLLAAGTQLSQNQAIRIKCYEFPGLYIYDELTEAIEINEVISEQLRIAAIKSMKTLNFQACINHAKNIVTEITNDKNKMIELTYLSSYHNYTYNHCINVAHISVIIGIAIGFTDIELQNLSLAALLHDIGKASIPIDILDKNGKLSEEEYNLIKKHPQVGYDMLKDNIDIPATVRVSIYSHHENEDGTGYPQNLTGDKIYKYAKIIHIADVFDALVSKRAYKEEMNPADALEYINSQVNKMFDYEIVKIFNNYVVLYTIGSKVELSDGRIGYVLANYQGQPSRPDILLMDGTIIELRKILNVTITQICK